MLDSTLICEYEESLKTSSAVPDVPEAEAAEADEAIKADATIVATPNLRKLIFNLPFC
jgi:hypothetical protein